MHLSRSIQSPFPEAGRLYCRSRSKGVLQHLLQKGESVGPTGAGHGRGVSVERHHEFVDLLKAAFLSDVSRRRIRDLSGKPRRGLDGSLDEWFEAAAWAVMNVSAGRPLFCGALAFLREGAELGLSHSHRKLESLGAMFIGLIESRGVSAATQKAVLSTLNLMLVRNEAFRSRYLASYAAAAGRLINKDTVPLSFKSRIVESIHVIFAPPRRPDYEAALEVRLVNDILESLIGILRSTSPASHKTPILYLFNRILSRQMLGGKVTFPTGIFANVCATLLKSRSRSALRELAMNGCVLLRKQCPHLMPLITRRLQREYSALMRSAARRGNHHGRRNSLEAVLRHVRFAATMPEEDREKVSNAVVSLFVHSKRSRSVHTSLRILASDESRVRLTPDEDVRFKKKIGSLVLTSGRVPDIRRAAIAVVSKWEPAIQGPPVVLNRSSLPEMTLAGLLDRVGGGECRAIGTRSLRVDLKNRPDECLFIKTVPPGDDVSGLLRECFWVEHLGQIRAERPWGDARFDIPTLLDMEGPKIFALSSRGIPLSMGNVRESRPAIGLVVSHEYFDYANSPPLDSSGRERLTEVLSRGSYLLAVLLSRGIIHCDVIPLFHRNLRQPPTSFRWWLGGRICRWQAFCRYPNIGRTGIRDFEHLISWKNDPAPEGYSGPGAIYKLIGAHILSLLLLAGSALRGTGDENFASAADGRTSADFRSRFDPSFLRQLLRNVLESYYRGLTGLECPFWRSIDCNRLAATLRDVMGRDLRMWSRFRKEDQVTVRIDEFRNILRAGGYAAEINTCVEKGRHDLYLIDGPHLEEGPREEMPAEIRRAVEVAAAICVMGLLGKEGFGRPTAGQVPAH
jgi:hypothetical protein